MWWYDFGVELGLVAIILGLLIIDISRPKEPKRLGTFSVFLVGLLLITHLVTWLVSPSAGIFFFGTVIQDNMAHFFKAFFLATTLLVLLMSKDYAHRLERGHTEFYLLILLASLGMVILASAMDFILLFVALELVTVSFYVMTTYLRSDPKSIEAGLKYLVLGALSSGFLLYGISFLYGVTGTTSITGMGEYATAHGLSKGLIFGSLLIIAGLGFKIASVPFHLWVPDVYEGSPTPVVAFLSVGSKAAGFLILTRLFTNLFSHLEIQWAMLFSAFSAMTLLYGNLAAIPQKNIKRFLGYSSIGHAGYLLMGFASQSDFGLSAVLYYLMSYLFTNLAVFLVIISFSANSGSDDMTDYAGLSQRSPFLAASMLIALMSLAGIPPLSGFFGKFLLITGVVKSQIIWLAILGAINVIIALYYYLVLVKRMYIEEPKVTTPIPVTLATRTALICTLLGIIALGVFQEPFLRIAESILR